MRREADRIRLEVDPALAELAHSQHGVVSAAQLQAMGLGQRGTAHRAAKGRLHRVHRGVYAVGHSVLGPDGRRMAAVLAAGSGSALSHRSSLDIHGVRRSQRPRHEVVRVGGSTIRTVDVHHTRSLPPADITRIRGIPTTTLARALIDCTPLLTDDALTRAIHEAEVLRILDTRAIRDPPPRLAAVIARYGPQPAHEGLETLFARLMPPDLPLHMFNAHVGQYEVDVLFPIQRVIVELDDRRTHQTTRAFQSDRAKDATLTALGYRVLRVTWHRLTHEPALVIAQLRAVLALP